MYSENLSFNSSASTPFHISESSPNSDDDSTPDYNSDSSNPQSDSNDELANKITTLAGQINAANYRFLKLIAEFDRRKAWEGPGIRSCAYWLAWKCGLEMNAAREKVRVARALEGLPGINECFEKGELSFSKVRAMTRVATEVNEEYLLMIAEHGTTQHVEKLSRAFRKVTRHDEEFANEEHELSDKAEDLQQAQKEQDVRSVSYYQDDDGMWVIRARLPAEEGGLLVKAMVELGERLAKKVSAETFSEYKEDASLDAEVIEQADLSQISFPQISFPQRRADALVTMAEHFLATASNKDAGKQGEGLDFSTLKGADRCQLVMHVHHTTSLEAANLETARLEAACLEDRWLAPDAALRLGCDASLLVVDEDAAGNVLDIGRRSRIIPVAMARALSIRDGGCCQFPGCGESHYVEGHHIKHWAHGGETKLDNLVTLCKHHHRALHQGEFFVSVKPTLVQSVNLKNGAKRVERFADRLCFSTVDRYFNASFNQSEETRRNKAVIARNPAKFTCACHGFDELARTLPNKIFETIDEKTAVTKWTGERMDLGMAVEGLLRKSG